jgi:hypothetical protein
MTYNFPGEFLTYFPHSIFFPEKGIRLFFTVIKTLYISVKINAYEIIFTQTHLLIHSCYLLIF